MYKKSRSRNKSRRIIRKRNKYTRKSSNQGFEQDVVIHFLEILNTIKLYHWKTFSYATHKATDELYSKLNSNIDAFVETLLGKGTDINRVNLTQTKTISLCDFTNVSDFKREVQSFKYYLVALNNTDLFKRECSSDLITIRDEMLKDVNQFLYLLSFS
jgi:hypothetical protein